MVQDYSPPGFFRKKKLLEGSVPPAGELSRQGRELAASGLFDEAVAFFVKAGDDEGLESVLEMSRREGDAFSFDAALRALGRTASKEQWEALGRTALEKGQLWFAYRAAEKADDQPGLERVRRLMVEQGIPPPS